MLRANGTIITTTFDELCSTDFIGPWQTALRPGEFATGKEFSTVTARLEAWTDDGWTPVETIIRHRANKPMYRVTTHTGVVTVTADHSLLTAHGTSPSIEISPSSLRVSETILLTSWPQQTVENVGALTDENLPWLANTKTFARIIGMFVGDGSCGSYGSGIHTKHTWAINNSDLEMLERYKKICIQTFNHDFAIHICTCGVHKLVPTGGEYGSVRDFAFQFGKLCYDNHRRKKVPDFLHASSREIRAEFLGGFYDADGKVPCQIDGGLKCFGHPIGASGLRMLYEMYLQLQGRAGERQLSNPSIGLTHNLGGQPANNVCSIAIIGALDS